MASPEPEPRSEAQTPPRDRGLPPLVAGQPWLLVLGSFPSQASLAGARYYGHPRNQFWDLAAALAADRAGGPPPPADDWSGRQAWLARAGIAVWDLVASCVRPGSLDQDIREATLNDVAALAASLPSLRAVALNGGTAAKLFRQGFPYFAERCPGIAVVALPSSSPIPTPRHPNLAAKRAAWLEAISPHRPW